VDGYIATADQVVNNKKGPCVDKILKPVETHPMNIVNIPGTVHLSRRILFSEQVCKVKEKNENL
jgi:hypothetical protein